MTKDLAIKILVGDTLGTHEQLQEAVIMAVKAIEAEPVKHGRWIVNNETKEWETVYCDQCHEGMWNRKGDPYPNYCYNCGAKMDL